MHNRGILLENYNNYPDYITPSLDQNIAVGFVKTSECIGWLYVSEIRPPM